MRQGSREAESKFQQSILLPQRSKFLREVLAYFCCGSSVLLGLMLFQCVDVLSDGSRKISERSFREISEKSTFRQQGPSVNFFSAYLLSSLN
jgi:hypothetical protein